MRTVSENVQIAQEPSVWEKVPVFYPQKSTTEKKSCFYELGAEKKATFGEYFKGTTPALVRRIREHEFV